jgi:hypothetical protein
MIQTLKTLLICSALTALLFILHSHAIPAHAESKTLAVGVNGTSDVQRHAQYFVAPAAATETSSTTPTPAAGPTPQAAAPAPAAPRDGSHDFDFEIGTWKIHLKKLDHPLTGSTTWQEFDGTSVVRKVWDGKSQLEEFESDSPSGAHIEGLTLRLYNPAAHQWNLNWATSKTGTLAVPTIGEFKNGVGEFYDYEPINDRMVLVRFIWSQITPTSAHFEQAFSTDGGKTWEANWITDQTRAKE